MSDLQLSVAGQEDLKRAIVESVTLSCLLTIDYVNGAKHPPIEEMVRNELPGVLRAIMQVENLGLDIEREILLPICSDPKALVSRVVQAVTRHTDAIDALKTSGHCDLVFGAMKYMRRIPQSDEEDIDELTEEISKILGCDGNPDAVIQAYTEVHTSLIKI